MKRKALLGALIVTAGVALLSLFSFDSQTSKEETKPVVSQEIYTVDRIESGNLILMNQKHNRYVPLEEWFMHDIDVDINDTVVLLVDNENNIVDMEVEKIGKRD